MFIPLMAIVELFSKISRRAKPVGKRLWIKPHNATIQRKPFREIGGLFCFYAPLVEKLGRHTRLRIWRYGMRVRSSHGVHEQNY